MYVIPSSNFEQLDLPISSYERFYKKFPSLNPIAPMKHQVQKEREILETFYKAYAKSMKETWSMKKITTIERYGKKVINKISLKLHLIPYNIIRIDSIRISITDVDSTTINPFDILTIAYHFQSL